MWDTLVHWFTALGQYYGNLFAPGSSYYAPCLVCAALIATAVYWQRDTRPWQKRIKGIVGFVIPKRVYLHRSALSDYRFLVVNTLVQAILFVPFIFMLLSALSVSQHMTEIFTSVLGDRPDIEVGMWAQLVLTICLVLAADLGFFIAHTLLHKVGFLWEFHKIHHSAEVLTPFTSARVHFVDTMLIALFAGIGTGMVYGVFDFFTAVPINEFQILRQNSLLFVFHLLVSNLTHSHVEISFGRIFNRILISPAHHQIHHSAEAHHLDKNMGLVFSFWDWMAGTLYLPDQREEYRIGLRNPKESVQYHGVMRMYLKPFYEIYRHCRRHDKSALTALALTEDELAELTDA